LPRPSRMWWDTEEKLPTIHRSLTAPHGSSLIFRDYQFWVGRQEFLCGKAWPSHTPIS